MPRPWAKPARAAFRWACSRRRRAFAQSERVAKLQLLPQIEAREKDTTSIWLDLQLKSGAAPLEGQKFRAGESELEFRVCPPPDAPESGAEGSESPDSGPRMARLRRRKAAPGDAAGMRRLEFADSARPA